MKVFRLLFALSIVVTVAAAFSSCGQIGSISGGLKDTLPPVLVSSTPKPNTVHFTGNKITLNFDEYIDEPLDIQSNLLVSPYPKTQPEIRTKLKTVTVKIKDTLQPNTTYAINFGKLIKDVNEGNVLKNFTYVFSTGNYIDSLSLAGRVEIAENGKTDSTLLVLLYRDAVDSTVQHSKPTYMAFVNGKGYFLFTNLPEGSYRLYALKDNDGGKTYNSKSEMFAFMDEPVHVTNQMDTSIVLYAYAEEKQEKNVSTSVLKPKPGPFKRLKFTSDVAGGKQDIRENMVLDFNKPIKTFDSTKIILTDTNYNPVKGYAVSLDSDKVFIKNKWIPDFDYRLIVNKAAVADSTDSIMVKTDTLHFKSKAESDYGNVVLRFSHLDFAKHPVLQFIQGDDIKYAYPITSGEWRNKLFTPGEYELRILFDDNNNGKWDPGSYEKKRQPEKVVTLPKKISIRENWDNESEINL
ncbi:MAG: Ig-like domain-containing protein [Bacteroidetes bacterium]|nr:Ig-like domain-containing protein [Bacteroidota bacterium]